MTFCLQLRLENKGSPGWVLVSIGLVPALRFAGSVISLRIQSRTVRRRSLYKSAVVDPAGLDARVPQVRSLHQIFLSHPGMQCGIVELGPVAVVEVCSGAAERHRDSHG